MDPQTVFCPNSACPARGQTGKGNIHVHSVKERRYLCNVCHKSFAETKGTVFYRLQTDSAEVTRVVTLLAHGCPLQAIVVAFALDERTAKEWFTRAGKHCEQVQEHLVQQPRDLGQVQADEIRAKMQKLVVWLALALQVSTRLWLGGEVSERRDEKLLTRLIERIRACVLCHPLLFCVDGWRAYVPTLQNGFREAIRTRKQGRPTLRLWDSICIAQMVKQYARGHVVGVLRRVVQGSAEQVAVLLQQTQGGGVINTAYVERLNATFRARLANLVRRSRALARQPQTLHHWVIFDWHGLQFLYESPESALGALYRLDGTTPLGLAHACDGGRDRAALLERARTAIVSRSRAALDAAKTTRTVVERDQTIDSTLVLITTIQWGAIGRANSGHHS